MAQFVVDVQKLADIIPMRACNVVNYNETCVWLLQGGGIHLKHVSKGQPQIYSRKGGMVDSLLNFVAASGVVLMLLWILKGLGKDDKEILAAEFAIFESDHILCNQRPWFYVVTKSGCTNTNIHAEIMKNFITMEIMARR